MLSNFVAGSVVALSVGRTLAAGVAWAGVNIAGFDFGCDINGACDLSKVVPPLKQYNGKDGAAQMKHFVDNDGLNAFRLPVGWQYLVNNKCGGTLDQDAFTKYDALVKACLDTGAYCIIDIHNYARWDGNIIGQGGPENDQFASLWQQLATNYAKESKVVMGLMNEPHDMPSMTAWATTVQAAVTAIRKAGATTQHILLPGTGYTSAGSFVSSGSAAALEKVTNLDGSTDLLIFDVHKYFDSDNSGTHASCVSNYIDNAFKPLASYLTSNKRQALLSEFGGGSSDSSCETDVCQVADYLNENSDAYLGFLGWSAGSFDPSYILSLTPTDSGADQALLTKCIAGKFSGGSGTSNSSTPSPPSASGTGSGGGGYSGSPSPSDSGSPPVGGGNPGQSSPVESASPQPNNPSLASPTTTPPPASTANAGGNLPISYGGSSSWGFRNTTTAIGTGSPIPTTSPYGNGSGGYTPPPPTTLMTSTKASYAQAAPASASTPIEAGPGNGDGASVWGSKQQQQQVGSGNSAVDQALNGGQSTDTGDEEGDEGEECDAEYEDE